MPTVLHLARAFWTLFEPIHALTYFAPEAREAFAEVGLRRYWDGYFAGRAAPLGAVNGPPVVAIFSGFAPTLVNRALPAVWSTASPSIVLEARARGAENALCAVTPDDDLVARAAAALASIAARVDTAGRPLAAANAALPPGDNPYRSLWQSTATLREHRGDGHIIALVTEQLAGLPSIVLRSAIDHDPATMQRSRGWSDDEWMHEHSALQARGLIAADGRATPEGIAAVARAEALTNRLAAAPWEASHSAELLHVASTLAPIAAACRALIPDPNPLAMLQPWNPTEDPDALRIADAPAPA
ncbi:SCO6745 family protein [Subtercola lobariae]|uniref:SalK n=1 Tax=Subtercola lobariae TaxID=1588641 RepID=A0A917B853_9MICO|nr:hypothetical protein [Subtercola lobariae]GGF30978.1 hypothetical protein GCM10011399_25240 [Subtercola lobariae]